MHGQWIGKFTGSNTGQAVVDIDDKGDHFEGYAFMFDDNTKYIHIYFNF
jgi:hypothetical protein